jgi:ABC-type branched-subunit amino acid transport system substrate-binding protein
MAADGGPPRVLASLVTLGPRPACAPSRGGLVFITLILLLSACTESMEPLPPAGPNATPTPTGAAESFVVRVVATLTGPDAEEDVTFLDGIGVGERVANRLGGVLGQPLNVEMADDGGDDDETVRLVREAARAPGTSAVLVVGLGEAVAAARRAIEISRTPVFLLGGDLYSTQGLFRQVFQVSIPLRWQAAVLARYLLADREYSRVATISETTDGSGFGYVELGPGVDAFTEALVAEGHHESQRIGLDPGFDARSARETLEDVEQDGAVAYFGGPVTGARVTRALARLATPPQLVTLSDGLLEPFDFLPAGTAAPYSYAWAGWAKPIRRVAAFRDLCERHLGHLPVGFEQEGYDAVRLLADGLRRSDGRGGDALVAALESFTEARYSSTPIRLGPDDHLLPVDRWVGIFAVEREGDGDPWGPSWAAWRPVMRTFTTNGERTIIPDIDRDVFFPSWRPREPAPDFWTARYGITTRRRDPLH